MLAFAAVAAVAALWPPRAGEDLVIYSAMGPGGPLIAAFEAATGERVTYINMAGGPMQARIYAEGRHPRWTLTWFIGDAASPAPATWPDLRTVANGVGFVSPVMSGTAYPVLASMMQAVGGSEPGRTLLRQLSANGLIVAATNPLLIGQLRRGEVGVAVLPSQAAYALAAREPDFDVTVPRPAAIAPAVIGISAGASPALQEKAQRFIRFLLTPAGQALIRQSTAEGFGWPPIEDVASSPGLPELAGLDLVHPDPIAWGARQGEEVGWFRREIAP